MQRYKLILPFITAGLFIFHFQSFSQEREKIKWYDPAVAGKQVIQGQAWFNELKNPYDRLPGKAEAHVRTPVWNGSRNAAGLNIRFTSNAAEIIVRYVVKAAQAMPHMPATGVSGVDLYAFDKDGVSEWAEGKYQFGDTIEYRFSNLNLNAFYQQQGRLYQLYLPLYNQVKWLQIGIADNAALHFLPVRPEKPIVVYGTSIAQGACASRPGMAWTALLERKLDQPLINLGFSGNGRLEKEVLDVIAGIDARLIILDCLPNLDNKANFTSLEVKNRILSSVKQIRLKHPAVPILLTEHCGGTINQLNTLSLSNVKDVNQILQETFKQMRSGGEENIYLLPAAEIAFNNDCTVDGTHPNDLGMQHYADAYEKIIRKILYEPAGSISSTKPSIQYRDAGVYNWQERHGQVLSYNKQHQPKTVFIGNSITHYWGGAPEASIKRGSNSWDKYFKPRKAVNLGYGWDRIENVLWRVYHGELDGYKASDIVLLIGTNNLSVNTDEEIIFGLDLLLNAIKIRQPEAKMLLMGLLPRRDLETRIAVLNKAIAKLAGLKNVVYLDTGKLLLDTNQKINEALFSDGIHPNTQGYDLLGRLIDSRLSKN